MMKRASHTYVRCASILLVLVLLMSGIPLSASAAEVPDSGEPDFVITGMYDGQFKLAGDKSKLFHLDEILPGDTWTGKIRIKNEAPSKMTISLLSIVSNLEDTTLFEALTLDISVNGKSVYSGSYSTDQEPIMSVRDVAPGKTLTLDVTVTLPRTTGNAVMEKEMDADWIFEATYKNTDRPDNPNEDPDNPKTGDETNILLLGGVCFASFIGLIILFVYDRKNKKEQHE